MIDLEEPLELNPTVAAALKALDYDGVAKIEYNAECACPHSFFNEV
jgi:hypothetical protein